MNLNGQSLYMLTGEQITQIAEDAAKKASDAVRKELKDYRDYGSGIWSIKEVADIFHVDPRTPNSLLPFSCINT